MAEEVNLLELIIVIVLITVAGIINSILGAAIGALCGEILDHIPYLNHAIPEGLYYLANYINPSAAEYARNVLVGNLDKVGAVLGFICGFVALSKVRIKK